MDWHWLSYWPVRHAKVLKRRQVRKEGQNVNTGCTVNDVSLIFSIYIHFFFFLLSVLPIFQVIRFPVSIFINTTKKSRKFLIFWSFFRMMAAQVPIEMVHAIQGNFSTINDRFKNFKHILFYFSAKNVPQKVEPKMALVPVDLASAVFVWINCSTFLTRGHLHIT